MYIDIDSIVKTIDIEELIQEGIKSKIQECIDSEDMVESTFEDEKLIEFVNKRVKDIIDEYLSTEEGKNSIIEMFKERVVEEDVLVDDRITDIVAEFLTKSLSEKQQK